MTRTFFADSSNWIALLRPRDRVHRPAQAMAVELAGDIVVTTEMLLVEVFNHMSRGGGTARRAALRLVLRLQQDAQTEIIPQATGQFRAAAQRYADRPDQLWSGTDCASFLAIEERGIARSSLTTETSNRPDSRRCCETSRPNATPKDSHCCSLLLRLLTHAPYEVAASGAAALAFALPVMARSEAVTALQSQPISRWPRGMAQICGWKA